MSAMRHGDAFAGIGAFGLAVSRIGWRTVWACENNKFCREVYEARLGHDGLRFDRDIRYASNLPPIDILTGGWPCTDLSVAGKRAGLAGERSGLFFHLARILHGARPEFLVCENVPGLLSSAEGRDMQSVLHGLTGACPTIPVHGWGNAGFCVGPAYAVAWRVLDSRFFGVAQRRRRVFFVGHSSSDFRVPAAILFEQSDGSRNPPSRRKAGTNLAHSLGCGSSRSGRLDANGETYVTRETPLMVLQDVRGHRDKAQHGIGIVESETCFTLSATERHAVMQPVAYTLRSDERNNSNPACANYAVAFAENQRGEVRLMDEFGALSAAGGGRPGHSYPVVACAETAPDRMRDPSGVSPRTGLVSE